LAGLGFPHGRFPVRQCDGHAAAPASSTPAVTTELRIGNLGSIVENMHFRGARGLVRVLHIGNECIRPSAMTNSSASHVITPIYTMRVVTSAPVRGGGHPFSPHWPALTGAPLGISGDPCTSSATHLSDTTPVDPAFRTAGALAIQCWLTRRQFVRPRDPRPWQRGGARVTPLLWPRFPALLAPAPISAATPHGGALTGPIAYPFTLVIAS